MGSSCCVSVTGDAADVDGAGTYWIPQGEDCHLDCQIEDMHRFLLTNTVSALAVAQYSLLLYVTCLFIMGDFLFFQSTQT